MEGESRMRRGLRVLAIFFEYPNNWGSPTTKFCSIIDVAEQEVCPQKNDQTDLTCVNKVGKDFMIKSHLYICRIKLQNIYPKILALKSCQSNNSVPITLFRIPWWVKNGQNISSVQFANMIKIIVEALCAISIYHKKS